MAGQQKKSGSGGVFGFFKKSPPATKSTTKTGARDNETVAETVVESVPEIAALLMTILEEKLPVRVFLGDASFPYYTLFEWELLEDETGKIVEDKGHLERGESMILAALDPPIGNLKIRTATEIHIEFFTRFHLLNCQASLKEITGARKLCMTFPERLTQKQQRRESFRAPVDRRMEIVVSVTRPSGIVFGVKLADLSVGGAAFYPTGATPKIADHSRVEMEITFPEGHVQVDAVILGSFAKDGEQFFRAQFLVSNHKTSIELGEVVSYIQRESVQKRIQTFE